MAAMARAFVVLVGCINAAHATDFYSKEPGQSTKASKFKAYQGGCLANTPYPAYFLG